MDIALINAECIFPRITERLALNRLYVAHRGKFPDRSIRRGMVCQSILVRFHHIQNLFPTTSTLTLGELNGWNGGEVESLSWERAGWMSGRENTNPAMTVGSWEWFNYLSYFPFIKFSVVFAPFTQLWRADGLSG